MAAKPKLTPEQWAGVRVHWEQDPREGYAWIVEALALPVSGPGVRKVAIRDGWAKKGVLTSKSNSQSEDTSAARKPGASRQSSLRKVSQGNHAKVSETIKPETFDEETLPLTTVDAVNRDQDQFGLFSQLTDRQEMFVREYMVDWNARQAAIRAGYSPVSAQEQGSRLLTLAKVREAIETLASARARRLGIDADELMRVWASIVSLDANEISQLRRVCCSFCWGEGHQRQYTPSGLEDARKKHERERARLKKADADDDIGEFPEYTDAWYDKRKEPHENCPECHGQGIVEVFFTDTRKLSPAARLVYAGVKAGRDGIEILTMSKEKAADNLARALGLFKEKEAEVNINMVSGDELYRVYEEKMQRARERQTAVLAERGLIEATPMGDDGAMGG